MLNSPKPARLSVASVQEKAGESFPMVAVVIFRVMKSAAGCWKAIPWHHSAPEITGCSATSLCSIVSASEWSVHITLARPRNCAAVGAGWSGWFRGKITQIRSAGSPKGSASCGEQLVYLSLSPLDR
jgi:hypothetical protein